MEEERRKLEDENAQENREKRETRAQSKRRKQREHAREREQLEDGETAPTWEVWHEVVDDDMEDTLPPDTAWPPTPGPSSWKGEGMMRPTSDTSRYRMPTVMESGSEEESEPEDFNVTDAEESFEIQGQAYNQEERSQDEDALLLEESVEDGLAGAMGNLPMGEQSLMDWSACPGPEQTEQGGTKRKRESPQRPGEASFVVPLAKRTGRLVDKLLQPVSRLTRSRGAAEDVPWVQPKILERKQSNTGQQKVEDKSEPTVTLDLASEDSTCSPLGNSSQPSN